VGLVPSNGSSISISIEEEELRPLLELLSATSLELQRQESLVSQPPDCLVQLPLLGLRS